ncbi:5-oxoprolinase subunit B family protein [Arenivirga flava]|uniref:Allophanate hydrolase n=1 Tax=Arenivirga flava TaxID=1930060 RepID=A0AA37XAX8_9MICO|nr:carboxyltransferase domain-containing protein [Arenivirga flava]GMA27212.1 allophanate hydrolase [Arenivirga flava]
MNGIEIAPCGPAALRVTGVSGDRERDWRTVHHLARGLAAEAPAGYLGSIPTYESVLVEFDALATTGARIRSVVDALLDAIDADAPLSERPRRFTVPVVYGGEHGPDLDDVARLTGLDAAEVVRLHGEPTYTVRCLGAPGGSPMLDGPAFPVPVPRLASPRTSVPVGAISVAGRQATLTPAVAPGGWCVIGRTPLRVMDLTQEPPVPYRPGDTLRFRAIDDAEFARLDGAMLRAEEVLA